MKKDQPLYGKIFKNVVLLGGVQIVQVLATVVRGKFVVLFLGTTGIGINALFTSVILVIVQLSGLGIQYSGVRALSMATVEDNKDSLPQVVFVLRHWLYGCSIIGGTLMLALAMPFSLFSFGHTGYRYDFMLAAIVVAANVLYNGNISLLQGTGQLSKLAFVTLLNGIIAMITVVPTYYILGTRGIMPAILISALLAYGCSWLHTKHIRSSSQQQNLWKIFERGRSIAALGILIMVSNLLVNAAMYLINTYIRNSGSLNDVGLYSSGISITNQYIGVVFTALAADYFPKLSAIAFDTEKVNVTVNSQAEIVMLVSAPLLAVMMLTAPLLIQLLLSGSLLSLTNFIHWAALGMFLKATSFSAGYLSFAKGDKKTFFLAEGVIGSLLIFLTSTVGYELGGVTGIAIGILVCYFVYLIGIHLLCYRLYHYRPNKVAGILFLKLVGALGGLLISLQLFSDVWGYLIGGFFLIVILCICYKELNNRIFLQQILRAKFKR